MSTKDSISIIMLGASGAVGGEVLKNLLKFPNIKKITSLGRRKISTITKENLTQFEIDIFDSITYKNLISGHEIAICTLGVGQPSLISKEEFLKIDKEAVINFAKECKNSGVEHFSLLSAVGVSSKSSSFYLRTKGELNDELVSMNFRRLSIIQPSMILTPENRYGIMQGITLAVWPSLDSILIGSLKKFRGIKVELLCKSIAENIFTNNTGTEYLTWEDFQKF